jgi:Uma2 family endonuclease
LTTADSEPEPDLAIVRGPATRYVARHPGPLDVALVIEVADSSLQYDRGVKAELYARGGIPAYWIVNLVDSCVEVMTDPTPQGYRRRVVCRDGESLDLVLDGAPVTQVAVRELLA